jgi:hypothetical protein
MAAGAGGDSKLPTSHVGREQVLDALKAAFAADEDTVRDVIHTFNARGLAALDPRWPRGRPRLISDLDIAASALASGRRQRITLHDP